MFRLEILSVLLAVVLAPPVVRAEEPDRRRSATDTHAEGQAPAPDDHDASWEFQVSGHGGFAGLASRGEVQSTFGDAVTPAYETLGQVREMNWGAGMRALRGRWGFEFQYHRMGSQGLTPAAQVRQTPWTGARDLALPDASANVLGVLGVAEIPFRDQDGGYFIAAGAGYVSTGGESDRLVFDGLPPGLSRTGYRNGEPVDLTVRVTGGDLRADGGFVAFAGSVGVTLRFGCFVVRPRLDGFIGKSRGIEESWDLNIAYADIPSVQSDQMLTVNTRIRPRFLLFNVDVGWSSRP